MLGFLSRFVDSNDRELKRIQPFVDEANELEAEIEALSDDGDPRADRGHPRRDPRDASSRGAVRRRAPPPRPRAPARAREGAPQARTTSALQDALDDVLPEVFAMAREAMKRTLGMRHFDVQLIGGVVLHQGKIAEMRTGEGKTLVPTLAGDPQRARPAAASTSSPSTTTSPAATRSGWARSSTSSGCQRRDDHPRRRRTCSSPATRRPTSG